MTAPLYIVYGPLSVYAAAAGTAAPTYVTTAPGVGWTLLGTNGGLDLDESGVKVTNSQKIEYWRGQHSAPVAGARTEEDLMIAFSLADVQANNYAWAMNTQPTTTTAASSGVPGTVAMNLYRGPGKVTPIALLLRGTNSPSMDAGTAQFYVPYAFQEGDIEQTFSKGNVRLLAFSFRALENPSGGAARLGVYTEQTAAAS